MLTFHHINETYFLAVDSLNPSLTPCLQLYNIQIYLLQLSFRSLTSKTNISIFLVACYPKKIPILVYLMAFKLKRRLINISCCRFACKNISYTLRFALRSLNTSAALYLASFNVEVHHTYIVCCILSLKQFTGTFVLTFYFLSTFFVAYLYFLTFNCIQRKVFFGLKPLKRKVQITTSFIAPK